MRDVAADDSCPMWNSMSLLAHIPRLPLEMAAAHRGQLKEYRHPQTCQLREAPWVVRGHSLYSRCSWQYNACASVSSNDN